MDILEDPSVVFGRRVTSFLGFWPFQSYEKRFFRSCIVSFSLLYAVLIQLCQLLMLDFNLRSIILILQMFLPFVTISNIYCICLLNSATVQELYSLIIQDWLELKDEMEMKIMQTHLNEIKLFPKIWGVMFCIYISSYMFPSILNMILSTNEVIHSMDRYPMYSCFPYILRQEYLYYFIVIYQILTVVIMTTSGIATYSGYIWMIQHICARLSIVKNKLNQPFKNCHRNSNVSIKLNDCSEWMIDIIQHLTRTVQFMALVNKVGEKPYLFQMSAVFFVLILNLLCLFQIPSLLKHKKDWTDAFEFLLFTIATVLPVYINCYAGQRVIDYSMEVYREMSLVPIDDMSLKTQKLLLMTLMMNSRPCSISIGKMFVSSHEFFSDLLRSSLSFAMVLRSAQNS